MKVVRQASELHALSGAERAAGRTIGFTPTMGALHEGHRSLFRLARDAADVSVVSIFVNPLQFGPSEDLEAYPRDEGRDLEACEEEKVDIVFLPSAEEMYPEGATTRISVGRLGDVLEGVHRPGHFDGVCTVVAKLFHIVQPHLAFFGQKDAQQVAVLMKMVADLNIPVEIVVGPTIREPDGLALSSRNAYLRARDRDAATALYEALRAGEEVLADGGPPGRAEEVMRAHLTARGADVDYACVVDPRTFEAPVGEGPMLAVVAARLGGTRLIDNLVVGA